MSDHKFSVYQLDLSYSKAL